MRHYPGGLAEWMESEPLETHPARAATPRVHEPIARAPRATPARRASPTHILYALADFPVNELFRWWLAMVVGCGLVYWILQALSGGALVTSGGPLPHDARALLSAIYFSAVTATSVGYGDVVPVGVARLLAIAESMAGLVIFGVLISKFVSRRQEEVLAEIHRIAFEDRLDRMRTNLHLVRTELQTAAQQCEGHAIAPPAVIGRIESIAIVFVGELHAIHDLLYRPQETPEEPALEMILASLTSVFRELSALLRCVDFGELDASATLRSSLSTTARLAREICGDCVPRQYAPALRTWMDQIQRIAGELAQI